jgi:tetratricopeptide (TPR) repeat protein
VADDTHLWAETFDRELEDVFAIQDEISQAVVQNLKVKLLGTEAACLVKDYTKNTEAYELFLKGKYTIENKGPFGFEKAVEYMEKAIRADPDYVPAHAHLATFYSIGTLLLSLAPRDTRTKTSALLQRALELDDQYSDTYAFLGMEDLSECKWKSAQTNIKRALQLNQGLPHHHNAYSCYFLAVNRMNEAIVEAKRAVELDPLSGWYRSFLARILSYDKKFDQAIGLLQEVLELDPNDPFVLGSLGEVYAAKGKYDKGISMLQKVRIIPVYESFLGYCYGKGGKKEDAQKILDGFLERAKRGYFSPFMIAMVHAGLGNNDKTFEYLDKAYEAPDPLQLYLKVHPFFSELHSDPRWTEQLKKRGLAD